MSTAYDAGRAGAVMILQFTCPCGNVFHAGPSRGERGVCAKCRALITEAMELAAVVVAR